MKNSDCIALILAGGRGSRLSVLTKDVSKPALPFGGAYRLIDFTLSNCVHSNVGVIGILTQYRQRELAEYIGSGKEWHTAENKAKITTLQSKNAKAQHEGYHGTADAIWKNLEFVEQHGSENVLVLSGDHIYKMDYSKMLEAHQNSGAAVTIAAIEVLWNEASRFGIINTDENDRVIDFDEKPQRPKNNLASMGVYIFNREILKTHLYVSNNNPDSSMDIGRDIIPQMLYFNEKVHVYRFDGYWRDVGNVYSYWEASMDLLNNPPSIGLCDDDWQIISRNNGVQPYYVNYNSVNESAKKSIVAGRNLIRGRVIDSVISADVEIGDDANIYNSVIMPGAKIGKGASVIRAIVGSNSVVGDYTAISNIMPDGLHLDNYQGINVIGNNINISAGSEKRAAFSAYPHREAYAV